MSTQKQYYAFQGNSGDIYLGSIAERPADVKRIMIDDSMGWRYKYPDKYSREDEWQFLLSVGRVVPITISVGLHEALTTTAQQPNGDSGQ